MSTVYHNPPETCNMCNIIFEGNGLMYDVRMPNTTHWMNICEYCFNEFGCQLGKGYGQKYELRELDDDKRAWVKIEG